MRAWAEGLKPAAWPKVWLKFWTASSNNLRRSSRQSKLGDLAMRSLSAKLSLLVLLLIAMLISAVVAGNSVAAKHLGQHFHERLTVMFFCFYLQDLPRRALVVMAAARAIFPKKNTTAMDTNTTRSTTTRRSSEKKKRRNLISFPKKMLERDWGELA